MNLTRSAAEAQIRNAAARGDPAEILAACRAAVAACPDEPDFWFDLGYYLRQNEEPSAALDAYARALALGASGPEVIHLNRAVILSDDLLDDSGALAELAAALDLRPDFAAALMNLGNLHEERGERAEALDCYRRVLAPDAAASAAEAGEARARRLRLEAMEEGASGQAARALKAAFEDAGALPPETRANLGFALGQVLERGGQIADAFEAYSRANAIAGAPHPRYDRARAQANAQALIDAFPAPRPLRETADEEGADLIFICGLHRSGSSLAERVLSMHADVAACGELPFLQRLAARDLAPFPAGAGRLDAAGAGTAAQRYRDRLAAMHAPRPGLRYTDKRPQNFLLIGLILQLFPEAKIIHTVRDRRDVMVSIFGQHLDPRAAAYAGDPGDIAHYMGLQARIMDHWRALHPQAIFDLDYDAFVRAPDDALARLTAWLGLPAQDDLLDFHARPGTVKTASYWQVRNPVNRDSSGRWRAWAPHMGEAFAALARAGLVADRG